MEDPPALLPETKKEPVNAQEIALPDGFSRLHLRVEVPAGTRLAVEIEAYTPDGRLLGQQELILGGMVRRPWRPFSRMVSRTLALFRALASASAATLAGWLVWASLAVYLATRLIALPVFPIYFFTDEAVQTVLAADFLRDGLQSSTGELLPTFFQNGTQYNLGTSVYLQLIPYFFFGKSIWVTRGSAALMTVLAAFSVAMVLKKVFKNNYPWLAVLFLSITPAWFLHSRTAFETSLATTFFAVFLFFYLMYREGSPRYLYGAVISGALAFYSYSPARIVMLVAGLLLLISDWRYHLSQRKLVLRALGLVLLLALPFARFLYNHPEASWRQMRMLSSVWVMDVPWFEKLDVTLGEYLHGLDPLYWYLPHSFDLVRHIMPGYGHLLRPTLPLGLLGIGIALKNIRKPAYRVLIIAVLAAPSGAALVRLGVTRAMFMVIPMAILTALAASSVLEWVQRRSRLSVKTLSGAVFLILALVNGYMLFDALLNGPTWFRGYSLAGMQYGARQIFGEIAQYLEGQPDTQIILSPSWANGTDVTARFFFSDPLPFALGSAEGYYSDARPLDENLLFIMIPEEYKKLPLTRFSEVKVEKILPYPDGRPGFYFVRLKYVDNIQEVIAQELEERRELDRKTVMVGADEIQVSFSKLDMGEIDLLFDGNSSTLVRTWGLNPMYLTFDFSVPRERQGIVFRVGGTATVIDLQVWVVGQEESIRQQRKMDEVPDPRDVLFDLPAGKIARIQIEISNVNDPPDGHVHLWDVTFQ